MFLLRKVKYVHVRVLGEFLLFDLGPKQNVYSYLWIGLSILQGARRNSNRKGMQINIVDL